MDKLFVAFPALPSLPPGHPCPPRGSNHQHQFSRIQLYPQPFCILDWYPLRQRLLLPSSAWTQWVHNVSADNSSSTMLVFIAHQMQPWPPYTIQSFNAHTNYYHLPYFMNKKSEMFKAGMTFPWSHNHLQEVKLELRHLSFQGPCVDYCAI